MVMALMSFLIRGELHRLFWWHHVLISLAALRVVRLQGMAGTVLTSFSTLRKGLSIMPVMLRTDDFYHSLEARHTARDDGEGPHELLDSRLALCNRR